MYLKNCKYLIYMIEIFCINCNTKKEFPLGLTLSEIAKEFGINGKYPILAALVNNKLKEMSFQIFKPKTSGSQKTKRRRCSPLQFPN